MKKIFARAGQHARLHGGPFALPGLIEHAHVGMLRGKLVRDAARAVAAVIVDDDDFDRVRLRRHEPIDLLQTGRQAALFVVGGNDDGQQRRGVDDRASRTWAKAALEYRDLSYPSIELRPK